MKYLKFIVNYSLISLKYLFLKKVKGVKFPQIMTFDETIDLIIDKKISISRFGDGELNLLNPKWSIGFQEGNNNLSENLKKVLLNDSPNCMICLPDTLNSLKGYTIPSKYFWMEHMVNCYKNYSSCISISRVYGNTNITRCYMDYTNKKSVSKKFDKLKLIWNDREILIVEGQQTRLGIGNDLFANAKSINRILTLNKNAFSKLEQLIEFIKKQERDKLILIALGPTATILTYELSLLGFQAIDIGHIDIEYEWFLKGTKKKMPIKYKYVNELIKGQNVEAINDIEYERQITTIII